MLAAFSISGCGSEWSQPSLNGDPRIASRSRIDAQLYVLHADAMGHGLTAALPLLPIAQIFRAMTERGLSLPVIVHGMNTVLKRQIPRGFFVAATVAVIDRRNRMVEVWNGSNPDACWSTPMACFCNAYLPITCRLGIQSPERFAAHTCCWQVHAGEASLILYSDGLTEARNRRGDPFGQEHLMAA